MKQSKKKKAKMIIMPVAVMCIIKYSHSTVLIYLFALS